MTAGLAMRDRLAIGLQRAVGRVFSFLWIPIAVALMHWVAGWRIEGAREARRTFADARQDTDSPLLVCANHLTMADSFLIADALGSAWWYLIHYSSLPWNTPERHHFASTWWKRALVYLMKCVPVQRGGDRREVGRSLARIAHLLSKGDVALIFPEGGRSRTGRVDTGAVTYGVGRLVKQLPRCRVLCVYLRGDRQQEYSDVPQRGERFQVLAELFEPKSDHPGLRGSVDLGSQILTRLAAIERRYFNDRQ